MRNRKESDFVVLLAVGVVAFAIILENLATILASLAIGIVFASAVILIWLWLKGRNL